MHIQTEHVIDVFHEMDELVKNYFARTEAAEGMLPLDMDWDFYITLQGRDKLVLITVRDEKYLVGFVMYVIGAHPHHKGRRTASCDILATRLEMRGMGLGTTMVRAAEDYLKSRKVQMVVHGFRTCYSAEPLFPKLGYNLIEQSYMKVL